MIYAALFGIMVFGLLVIFQTLATGGVPESRTPAMKRRVRNYRR